MRIPAFSEGVMNIRRSMLAGFGAAAVFSLGVCSSAQAAWVYHDIAASNTVNAAEPSTAWIGTSDTAAPWRERLLTGPAAPAAPAGSGTAYTGRLGNVQSGVDDPNLLTTITGLDPNTEYNVRVYGVYPGNNSSRHFAQFSTDGGTTFEFTDNRYDNNTDPLAGPVGLPIVWVDASDGGVGAELGARQVNTEGQGIDTRYYTPLTQTLTSDGSGNASILLGLVLENPDFAGAQLDRFNIDGYAIQVVPEPSAMALLGLGGMALAARRRK